MIESTDHEFLRSLFLVEAWDTLAAVEDAIGRLATGAEPAWDELFLVTHRLKGAASLHGFPQVAGLADAVERALQPLPPGPTPIRRTAADDLTRLLGALKSALDAIERDRPGPDVAAVPDVPSPEMPCREAEDDPVRRDLLRFLGEGDEVLAYFGPEADEHLEAMTHALLALEHDGTRVAELDALLRTVHTFKGAAYVVGCTPIGDLAHALEDVLVGARARRAPLSPTVVEAGFAAIDTFKRMLDPASDPSLHLTAAVRELRACLSALLEGPATAVRPSIVEPPPGHSARRPAARDAARARTRQTIRVALERLDGLMGLVAELVVARRALERRLGDLGRLDDVLAAGRARLDQALVDVERRRLTGRGIAQPPPASHPPPRRDPELFDDLALDRDDDLTPLVSSVARAACDLTEVQAEITGLRRTVREDLALMDRLTGDLRAGLGRARLVPIGSLFTRFVRQGREVAHAVGKDVRIETRGESVELDAGVIEQIVDPLLHLVQNAVVHGLETADERITRGKPPSGTVSLGASHRGAVVVVEVADDGRGIDAEHLRRQAVVQGLLRPEASLTEREALELIFRPGFSTAAAVTPSAGRGVGLDVVRTNVGRLNGQVEVESVLGAGTRFTLRLPLTVLVTEVVLVRVGTETLAVPFNAVHAVATPGPGERGTNAHGEAVHIDDRWLPSVALDRALGLPPSPAPASLVLRTGAGLLACAVSQVLGTETIIVKPLGAFLDGVGPYAGATVSADGRLILLLDPGRLGERRGCPTPDRCGSGPVSCDAAGVLVQIGQDGARTANGAARKGHVLLVDDSISVRTFVGQMLERAGFEVSTAADGAEALARLDEREFTVMVSDLEMPRLNGYALLEAVRQRPETRELPIVILTTRSGAKHRSLARRLGVSHYVTKPVIEDEFVRLVESLAPLGTEATA